jgi:hypothetical protein
MSATSQSTHDLFRILLYRNDASEILVETNPGGLRLPILSVPAHRREAEEITGAIKTSWNLETYGLFRSSATVPPHPFVHDYVVEACQPDTASPAGMQWLCVSTLSIGAFQTPSDLAAIQNSLLRLDQYRRNELPGPFGKPGWLQKVTEWVEAQGAARGLHLAGAVHQFNASPTFSLLRFETDGPALWFKAVGEPNAHEFDVTLHLAHFLPRYVPRVMASNREWNAWLSVESEGQHLSAQSGIGDWQRVAAGLADLQISSFGRGLHLVEIGCRDLRACSLRAQLDPFFDCIAELMGRQTTPIPPPLTRPDLAALAGEIRKALEDQNENKIPNVLGHLDCNPGNILVSRERCVFLDWAEGFIGHPFFTFRYLLEHWRRSYGRNADSEKAILSAYATPWETVLSTGDIARELQILPLVAAFAYAVGNQAWQRPECIHPETAGYLRSLVRRMKREADALKGQRLVCVP